VSSLPGECDDGFRPADGFEDAGLDPNVLGRRREVVLTLVALVLVLAAGAFTAHQVFRTPAPGGSELMALAHQAVRDAMPPAYALRFSPLQDTQISRAAADRHEVSARVIAVNRQGGTEDYTFTCVLIRFSDRSWRPAKLDLQHRY
jgi:hypothetical protein